MGILLKTEGVAFAYGSKVVLEDISFQVGKGDFLGIIGPNGSGKTTLLKVLNGVIEPRKGRVLFRDKPIRSFPRKELARSIGVVAQEYAFSYPFTVREIVLMGRYAHMSRLGFETSHDMEVALHSMRSTDIEHLADRKFHELSGGERQRVIIARALAQEPQIILFDEPTAFLDIHHQIEFFDFIWELNQNTGVTIVAVSHDINLAAQYCKEMALLSKGRVYRMGRPDEVVTEDSVFDVYGKRVLLDRNPLTGAPRITLLSQKEAFRKQRHRHSGE